ncbi:MAG: Uma2 family endonuclease [Rhizobacter sp.]|nr:Uma2 family endonuclease [Chlorobiales bacterium]
MITREEALLIGVNATKEHQRVICKLIVALGRFYEQGTMTLEPFPETMLNEGEPSPVPDVSLYDNVLFETPVIIEINHTDGIKNDLKKVRRLIGETDYGIIEGFVYDYRLRQWHKHQKGIGDVLDKPSFCNAINLDLSTLL